VLASGDAFIADTATRDVLGKRADLVDMEGYALATAAAAVAVPVSMAKHVSDEADEYAARWWLHFVSRAGLVPVMALAERAGLTGLVREHVRIAAKTGVLPEVKVGCLVAAMPPGKRQDHHHRRQST
jgi:hypothetical protein